jgi:O-antigen/teichoic acid export membrane protein
VVLRRQWLAASVLVAFFSVLDAVGETRQAAIIDVLSTGLFFSMCAVAVLRWGLTTLAVGMMTADLLLNVPVSRDLSGWYAAPMVLVPLSLALVAAWAFYRSIGGQLLRADPFA